MKEYRDVSVENKFIQKKKEIIALKQEAIERTDKARPSRPKEENLKNLSSGITKPTIPKSNNRLKFSAKERKLEETQPMLVPNQAKTADLFDNIHHFL
jgi:glutamyl-tRNA reductase